MAKYSTRHLMVDAIQWWKNGDHPEDGSSHLVGNDGKLTLSEGKIVRYFRNPKLKSTRECGLCGNAMYMHGWIDSGGDGRRVCPGDFIVQTTDNHYIPYRPEAFGKLYHLVRL